MLADIQINGACAERFAVYQNCSCHQCSFSAPRAGGQPAEIESTNNVRGVRISVIVNTRIGITRRDTRADLLGQAGSAHIKAHRLAPDDPAPMHAAKALAPTSTRSSPATDRSPTCSSNTRRPERSRMSTRFGNGQVDESKDSDVLAESSTPLVVPRSGGSGCGDGPCGLYGSWDRRCSGGLGGHRVPLGHEAGESSYSCSKRGSVRHSPSQSRRGARIRTPASLRSVRRAPPSQIPGTAPNFRRSHPAAAEPPPPRIHLAAINRRRSGGSGGSDHRCSVDPIQTAT